MDVGLNSLSIDILFHSNEEFHFDENHVVYAYFLFEPESIKGP